MSHFVLGPSWVEIFLLLISFYLLSELPISLLDGFFHRSHWGLRGCFNVRLTSCRITHMRKSQHVLTETGASYPTSLERYGSVTLGDAAVGSQDASCSWTSSARITAFGHCADLYSSHVVTKHSRVKPSQEQGTLIWNHCFFKGCFEKHIFLAVSLVSWFTTPRLHLS